MWRYWIASVLWVIAAVAVQHQAHASIYQFQAVCDTSAGDWGWITSNNVYVGPSGKTWVYFPNMKCAPDGEGPGQLDSITKAPSSVSAGAGGPSQGCEDGQIALNCYTGVDVSQVVDAITNSQSMAVVGLAAFVFLASFAWGWKIVQRGGSQ